MQDDAFIANLPVKVTDERRYEFFILDNPVFDSGVAKRIGPTAFMVFAYLVRRAGRRAQCWPKNATIAEDCGLSLRSVSSAINTLSNYRLIAAKRGRRGYIFEIQDVRYANFADQENGSDVQNLPPDVQILPIPTKEKNTHEEDTNKPTKKIHGISLVDLPEDISSEVATEFIQHRKLIKKPLTQKAFDRAMTIAAGVSAHRGLARLKYTPDQCITATIDAGWQGVNLDWIYNRAMGTSYSKQPEPRRPQPDLT